MKARKRSTPSPQAGPPRGDLSASSVRFILGGVLLGALLLRLLALRDITDSPYGSYLLWDERFYHEWAKSIAAGTYASSAVYEFAPLPAYLMAAIYRVFSPDVLLIRLLNVVLGTLSCGILYCVGRHLGGRRVGLVAALIAGLYKPFILYNVVPLKETLAVFLFAAVLWLLLETRQAIGAGPGALFLRAGLLGLAAGFLLNVRPNAIVILPIVPLWIALRARPDRAFVKRVTLTLAVLAVGFAGAVLPFMIRNYVVADSFRITTSQLGFNLYIGNNPQNPTPYFRPVPFAITSPFQQGIQFTIEASRRAGRTLSAEEASAFWTREVVNSAAARPAAFGWKLWQKALALLNQFEACDHYYIPFVAKVAPFFKLFLPTFWLILPLGMAGMLAGVVLPEKARPLQSIFLLYGLTLVLFFTNARYRLPLLTILIPFAAVAIDRLWAWYQASKKPRVGGLLSVFVISGVVVWLPIEASDDLTAYYNTHALALEARGRGQEAIQYWKISSEMNRMYSDFANLSLAQRAYAGGRDEEGASYLDRIRDDSFAAAQKFEVLGDSWVRKNRPAEAAAAYERALAINSGELRPRVKLTRLYGLTDPSRAVLEEQKLRQIESFYRRT
jgi:4-amino-4-deoxy-L-arabinose transferase-like glycosyltransferase